MPTGISTQPLISSDPAPPEAPKSGNASGCRVIAVTSGKGGVGKTNVATNLGISLASQGKKVCIFDADTSLANINILLGLTPIYTLEHLLNGERTIQDILLAGPGGLHVIPAASGIVEFISLNKTQQKRLVTGIKQLENQFDYLLIDTAAGISESLLSFLQAAPYTIITITPEPTSLTDAFSLLKVLKNRNYNQSILVVVNMATSLDSAHSTYMRFRDAVAKYLQLKVYYLGYILSDTEIPRAVIKQKPVVLHRPFSLASRCFQSLTDRLERALNAHKASHSLSSFWDEPSDFPPENRQQLQATEAAKASTASADERRVLKVIRDYLQKEETSTAAAEALQKELTQALAERFGHTPNPCTEEPEQKNRTPTEGKEAPHSQQQKPKAWRTAHAMGNEQAGLEHALYYARRLAAHEQTFRQTENPSQT